MKHPVGSPNSTSHPAAATGALLLLASTSLALQPATQPISPAQGGSAHSEPAAAQPSDARAELRAEFLRIVTDLDSNDFAIREGASQMLSTIGVEHSFVVELLKAGSLSAEQRVRLLSWLRANFEGSPRGAVGISFGMSVPGVGIQIATAEKDFPATLAGLIRAGDVLTEINGVSLSSIPESELRELTDRNLRGGLPLPYWQAMQLRARTQIVSFDPGELVPVKLLRPRADLVGPPDSLIRPRLTVGSEFDLAAWNPDDFVAVEAMLPLGSSMDLNRSNFFEPELFDRAWRARVDRLGLAPALLGSTIEPTGWHRADETDDDMFAQWANPARVEAVDGLVGATGGGLTPASSVVPPSPDSPRFAGLNEQEREQLAAAIERGQDQLRAAQRRLNQRQAIVDARVGAMAPNRARPGLGGGMGGARNDMTGARLVRRDSAQRLTDEIAEVKRMLDSYNQRAADPAITAQQRTVVEARIKQAEDRLQSLEERLRRAAAREAGVGAVPAPAVDQGGGLQPPRF